MWSGVVECIGVSVNRVQNWPLVKKVNFVKSGKFLDLSYWQILIKDCTACN